MLFVKYIAVNKASLFFEHRSIYSLGMIQSNMAWDICEQDHVVAAANPATERPILSKVSARSTMKQTC